MKLVKLSLVAALVASLGTSAFAADTLQDAFKQGKVTGDVKLWSFYKDRNDPSYGNGRATAVGGMLGYTTAAYYGVTFGATFQYGNVLSKKHGDVSLADSTVLSEGYLAYQFKNTTFKLGRQFIETPVVGLSKNDHIKDAFEGILVLNTDISNTVLGFAYVSKQQAYNTDSFDHISADEDGAFTLLAINNSINNLTLIGQYAYAPDFKIVDDLNILHLEAKYNLDAFGVDAMYRGSFGLDDLENNYIAVQAKMNNLFGFGLRGAIGFALDDEEDLVAGLGNGAANYLYTRPMINTTNVGLGENISILLETTYDFSQVGVNGLKALAQTTYADSDHKGKSYKERTYSAEVKYEFAGALKGFDTSLQYQMTDPDNKRIDQTDVRFRVNFNF